MAAPGPAAYRAAPATRHTASVPRIAWATFTRVGAEVAVVVPAPIAARKAGYPGARPNCAVVPAGGSV